MQSPLQNVTQKSTSGCFAWKTRVQKHFYICEQIFLVRINSCCKNWDIGWISEQTRAAAGHKTHPISSRLILRWEACLCKNWTRHKSPSQIPRRISSYIQKCQRTTRAYIFITNNIHYLIVEACARRNKYKRNASEWKRILRFWCVRESVFAAALHSCHAAIYGQGCAIINEAAHEYINTRHTQSLVVFGRVRSELMRERRFLAQIHCEWPSDACKAAAAPP